MADDLAAWLEHVGLAQYADLFAENAIDLEVLPHLSEQDLKDLGLPLGHRRKLQAAIGAGRSAAAPAAAAGVASRAPSSVGERRQLTILFCDLVGSTALSRRLDPEELNALTRAFQDRCAAVISHYGGYIARFMGDGVLAYFGYPDAHEDDAERACRSALEILAGTTRIAVPAAAGIGRLEARAGIETGLVVVGDLVRGAGAEERTVAGDAPNLAARLQALAGPGEAVIGPRTRRLLAERFEYRDLGARSLKGFDEPVHVFALAGEGRAETRFEAIHGRELTPFVGRDEEVATLLQRWRSAVAGEGQVAVLQGEPGIGKSRLLEQIDARASREGARRLRFQCSPFHASSALFPFIAHLEHACEQAPADGDGDGTLAALRATVQRGGAGWENRLALFTKLLSLDTGAEGPFSEIPAKQRRALTVQAFVDHIAGLAGAGPLLVLVEDAHWIDPTSLDVVNLLVETVQRLPVLLLVTCRPEFRIPWSGRPHVSLFALKRMSRAQCRDFVGRVTGGSALPPAVVEHIVDKTDGVPLFVEELTKNVMESDAVRLSDGRYELVGPFASLPVPETLHETLMARLDRRSALKEISQIGSAIGREFDYPLLSAISSLDVHTLGEVLDQLVDTGLVYRRGVEPLATYQFKHALVQDAVYESLLISRRREIHAAIAAALTEEFSERVANQPETLAHHYTGAGFVGRAVEYWMLAAERAAEQGSHEEACAHYRSGLETAAALEPEAERAERVLALRLGLIESLRTTDRYDEALEVLAAAERLARESGRHADLARAHYQHGNILFPLGRQEECLAEHGKALGFARRAGAVDVEAQALGGLGDAHYLDGRMRSAFQHFEDCVRLCREHGMERVEAANLHMVGWTRLFGFEFEAACADAVRAVDLARRTRHHRAEMLARSLLGWAKVLLGRVDDAEVGIDESIDIARRIGSRAFEARALVDRAYVQVMRGSRPEAAQTAREAIAIMRATNLRFFGPFALGALARITGDAAERDAALAEGEALLAEGCVSHNHFWFYRDAMEASLGAGDWARTEHFADALESYGAREPWAWSPYFSRWGRALAAWGRGERDGGARARLESLRDEARRTGLSLGRAPLDAVLAQGDAARSAEPPCSPS